MSRSTTLWSPSPLDGGNLLASSLENRAIWCLNSSGRVTLVALCSSVYLWAISAAVWVYLSSHFSLYMWSISAAIVHLTSTRPHPISGAVTLDHGLHSALAIDAVCRFLSSQFVTLWAVARWVVSIPILGPWSLAFSQLMSGVKEQNQGYPRIKLSFPRLVM